MRDKFFTSRPLVKFAEEVSSDEVNPRNEQKKLESFPIRQPPPKLMNETFKFTSNSAKTFNHAALRKVRLTPGRTL